MTRQFVSKLTCSLLALSLVSSAFAQKIKTLPAVTVEASTAVAAVNAKITKSFTADFKDAVGVKWYKLNKSYLATFISGDMNNSALYGKHGFLVYNIGYGVEQNLPKEVRAIIKPVYYDYKITSILKVNQDAREVWIVNMQDDKKLIIVRVEDGVMDEFRNYDNANQQ
jgi:hypothetical protein